MGKEHPRDFIGKRQTRLTLQGEKHRRPTGTHEHLSEEYPIFETDSSVLRHNPLFFLFFYDSV